MSEIMNTSGLSRRRILKSASGALAATALVGASVPIAARAEPVGKSGGNQSLWGPALYAGDQENYAGKIHVSPLVWVPSTRRIETEMSFTSKHSGSVLATWRDSIQGTKVSASLRQGEVWRNKTSFVSTNGYESIKYLDVDSGGDGGPTRNVFTVAIPYSAFAKAVLPSGASATITDAAECGPHLDKVRWALKLKLTVGDPQSKVDVTTFRPNKALKRNELASYLYHLAGGPYNDAKDALRYPDVTDRTWYKRAISWGVASGITEGSSHQPHNSYNAINNFRPEESATRATAAVFLKRYATNFWPASISTVQGKKYSDVSGAGEMAPAIEWLGSITEDKAPTFRPQDPVTRLEMVRFMHKLHSTVITM